MARRRKKQRRRGLKTISVRNTHEPIYIFTKDDRVFCFCFDGIMREYVQGEDCYLAIERDKLWQKYNRNDLASYQDI